MLTCSECKREVHFTCSGLPGYQIYLFREKRGYRKYVCEKCVGASAEYLLQNNKVEKLQERVTSLEK